MRVRKILSLCAIALGVILIVAGSIGSTLRGGSEALQTARARRDEISAHQTARDKTVPSALKKAETALSGASTAQTAVEKAADAIAALDEKALSGVYDDEVIDDLIAAGAEDTAKKYILRLYKEQYDAALKAVHDEEDKLISAMDGRAAVLQAIGLTSDETPVEKTAAVDIDAPEGCRAAVEALSERAAAFEQMALSGQEAAQAAAQSAEDVKSRDSLPLWDRILLLIADDCIGVVFTGAVLLIIGLVALLCGPAFARAWKKYPIFSTAVALMALVVVQVYALGFRFDTAGDWFSYWLSNALNVLRSNSSVGMIALGMTLVIITGGIDLAVGSTLAGVATVVMVLMDVSPNGSLVGLGVIGLPNYLIAIGAGIVSGLVVGTLIGVGATKGRIPPFIITLGVMNIVRSVAQYFTKGFKVEVPREIQVIANAEIGGQMLLPIIYWLLLALIMYVISKHTAFGRHIYAVGSNERTSRLSGINVDRVKLGVYMLMGFIVAVAAIVQVARLRGVDVASAGSGYEMNAIAAVVVGGTSMAGGRGSIEGTVLGVLIIGIMNNLLVLLGIDAFLANAFTGAIIIAAVLMQRKGD